MREAAVAGTFYSADPATLTEEIRTYLAEATPEKPEGDLLGLVSPHAGYGFSGRAAAFGFKLIDPERVERVVLLAASHTFAFRGVSIAKAEAYETPLGIVPMDTAACTHLIRQPLFDAIPEVHEREHSLEVQLPFLQVCLGESLRIVPLVIGQLGSGDHQRIADTLGGILREGDLLVASSDFTHQGPRFGYVPYKTDVQAQIRQLDMGAIEAALEKKSDRFLDYVRETGATICGAHPIAVLLKLLPPSAQGKLLAYYTSADVVGDDRDSVSYASIGFFGPDGWGGS
jgi:hypothetical protein